ASEEMGSLRRATDLVTQSALVYRVDGEDSLPSETGGTTSPMVKVGVSRGFFELFGVPMAMGRAFAPEDYKPQGIAAGVLSHHAWRTLFSADPAILGKTIRLGSGRVMAIVGVASPA